MDNRVYLDHNAATPPDPRVIEELNHFLKTYFGNPSSVHAFGRECRKILVRSRDAIASYLKVRPDEIIFTSGGTEGANIVIKGIFLPNPRGHIITTAVEHSCVYNTIKQLEMEGCQATYLEPGELGHVTPEAVASAVRPETSLIAVMAVNNETGIKSDVEGIAAIARREKIPYFVDAVALLGKEPFVIPEGVSAMCFSGQKIHGVQGTGFCFIKKSLKLEPLISGSDHQYGRHAGTENLPGIVALSKAVSILAAEQPSYSQKMLLQRNHLEQELALAWPGTEVNGTGPRVCNTSNLYFPGIDGESLLTMLDMEGIAVSHGSACSSGALEPSRVLLNMGYPRNRVNSSIRISLSRMTTDEELDKAIDTIIKVINQLKRK